MASTIVDPISKKFATVVLRIDDVLRGTPIGFEGVCLSAVKLHLTRWGEAVGIRGPVALDEDPLVESEDVLEAKEVLTRMAALIDHELGVHQQLSPHASNPDILPSPFIGLVASRHPPDGRLAAVQREIEAICEARTRGFCTEMMVADRQRETHQLLPPSCATEVTKQMTSLIANLEGCFPLASKQRRLCANEMQRLHGLEPELEDLVRAHACWPRVDPPRSFQDDHFMTVVREESGGCVCM
jgi:hypothetical protein